MNNRRLIRACLTNLFWVAIFSIPSLAVAQSPGTGRIEKVAVRVANLDRSYWKYVPPKSVPARPLVIVLHGTFMNGEGMREETAYGFERLADEDGFIVAYPDALKLAWNDCRKHNTAPARAENIDDVGLLREVIRAAVADHGVDRTKVFVFGFLGGGHLAYRMAWEAPTEIAGVATVGANLPPPEAVTCASGGKTPPILLFKGKADSGDPYQGGPHPVSGSVMSAHATAAAFARQNTLGAPDPETEPAPNVKLVTWRGQGRPVGPGEQT